MFQRSEEVSKAEMLIKKKGGRGGVGGGAKVKIYYSIRVKKNYITKKGKEEKGRI